jgi:hypothetical protein
VGCSGPAYLPADTYVPPPPDPVVTIGPMLVTVVPGGTQAFAAEVANASSTAVTFSIHEGATGGSVTAAGVYTAPPTIGIYHVVATSISDQNFSAVARVTVWPAVALTTPTGNLQNRRAQFSTATLLSGGADDGKVLVVGGCCNATVIEASAELYDPASGRFTLTGTMSVSRYAHTATRLPNGNILITGGFSGELVGGQPLPKALDTAELYDPNTGNFTATGSMSVARALHTATLLPNGQVLITGGLKSMQGLGDFPFGSDSLLTAELYDPASGSFTPTPGSMSVARYAHTATLLPDSGMPSDGKVLVVGGTSDSSSSALATAELFNPTTGTFTATDSLHAARFGHTATVLSNTSGRVLIIGGGSPTAIESTAEIYDPVNERFAITTGTALARFEHTATLLTGGDVLVAGGVENDGIIGATVELFDHLTETFTPISMMHSARHEHTATLLPSGALLLTGGEPLRTAELYP